MKSSPKSPAWLSDSYWKEVVEVLTGGKKLRPEHYLHNLTEEELETLRAVLSSSGSFAEQRKLVPPRRGGATDGSQPNISTLSEIAEAMRQVDELRRLETQNLIEANAKKRCGDLGLNTQLTNAVLHIVGEEALRQRANGVVDKFALKAAAVLMKRESQMLDERKLKLLEKKAAQADQTERVLKDAELTPEQREQRIKEIYGRA